MFWLNHECSLIWVDWQYLENPENICRFLLENTTVQLVVLDGATEAKEAKRQIEDAAQKKRFTVAEFETDSEEQLRQHFAKTYHLFDDVFVSGSPSRVHVANESAVGTILVDNHPDSESVLVGPDALVSVNQFEELAGNGFFGGVVGELFLFPNTNLLPGYERGKSIAAYSYKFTTDFPEIDSVYALGRYLRQEDQLQRRHHLTRLIKKAKYSPGLFSERIGKLIRMILTHDLLEAEGIEDPILTFVPAKPSDDIDRNRILLGNAPQLFAEKKMKVTLADVLECREDFPKQKELRTYAQKRENVRRKYAVKESVEGKTIILFDDVYTSGHTLAECARVLLEAGAEKVIPLCLGITCHESPSPVPPLTCEGCGSALHVSFRNNDGGAFWGCPNYADKKTPHPVVGFSNGILAIRALQIKVDDENFPF